MLLEISIPVLNEESSLVKFVSIAIEYLQKSTIPNFKIIIVDNASTDKTPELAKELIEKYPDTLSFVQVSQKGVGLALRTAWSSSSADIVGYMDLDLATDLKHLDEVYSLFTNNSDIDIVNGSRLLDDSKVVNRKLLREITSRGFNCILKFMLGVKISDGMCGFKFARRTVAQELIHTGMDTTGWIFSTEFLVKAEWKKKKIIELAVTWTDDQKSKVKILSLSWNYFKHLLKLRKEKKEWIKKYA